MRVAYRNGKGGLRGLLNADAGLCLALGRGIRRRLDWRRYSGSMRGGWLLVVVVVEVDGIHHAA
jgi:hypothetical protein